MKKKKIKQTIDKFKCWYSKSKIVSIIQSFVNFIVKLFIFIICKLFYHWKITILLLSIIGLYYLNQNENLIFNIFNNDFIKFLTLYDFHKNVHISQYGLELFIFVIFLVILIFSFRLKDLKQNKISKIQNFKNIKEKPYFKLQTRLWLNLKISVWYWNMNGVGLSVFQSDEFRESFQSAFNRTLIDVELAKGTQNIIKIKSASPKYILPNEIKINERKIDILGPTYILGENLLGIVKTDISKRPHMLIAGDTGSGKSVLIDSIIYQSLLKGYVVRACDPKQTEFNGWHNLTIRDTNLLNSEFKGCQFSRTTDLRNTLEDLYLIEDEYRIRMVKFAGTKCKNIDKYNSKFTPLSRIVYIFDEFIEMTTSKKKTAEEKAMLEEIERILKIIATRGRSLGIHLILSAQRPDCNLLDGQIKSNLSNRICGRMPDRSASETALGKGNYDACTLIDKDELGKFVTNDGKMFKGYLLDTEKLTEELHEKYDKQNITNLGGTNNVGQ